MNVTYFRRLFDYTFWAHRQVWECVLLLSDEQFTRPCDYSIGSVHEQVVHTMAAEWLWSERVRGVSPSALFSSSDYPSRELIRTEWDSVEVGWRDYLSQLHDEQLAQPLTYTSLNGRTTRQTLLWEVLAHVVNHGTDHRAQTLSLIHHVGGKTLEQDIIFYSWAHTPTD
ncbi:MAG: DinB family protein [Anaerolineae bacterium]